MGEQLWSFEELLAAVGQPSRPGPSVTGIGIDSRLIEPGDLFVALPGDPGPRFTATTRSDRDGHDFVADAVAKGAAAVLAHRPGDYGAPTLLVPDTLDALWQLGRAARRRLGGPVVAVTGSSGKTTFKSFAGAALGAFATSGSLNNHIGVPLSLARTPRDANGAVCEIGTNHPGEIEPLSRLVSPDAAVLLNVHPAHIENFGSLDAIRREKLSIAAGLGRDGTLIRPVDLRAEYGGRTATFGVGAEADVELLESGLSLARLRTPGGEMEVPVPGGGAHRASSVCAVAAMLIALDRPLAWLERLADVPVPRGRGNRIVVGGATVIDDSYNANPASMAATLDAFAAGAGPTEGRRIAILGDMLELGEDAASYHRALAPHCAAMDGVLCVGERMIALYDELPPAKRLGRAERADATFAERCAKLIEPGDSVLVKGSNGTFWAVRFVDALVKALE